MTATIPTTAGTLGAVKFEASFQEALHQPPLTAPVTEFGVACSHKEVLTCWRLVHECYVAKGLIKPNPYSLHTSTQALNEQTAVIYGKSQNTIDTTLSVIPDGEQGLPLDQVYPHILDKLRSRGRHLFEVGLLADARQNVSRELGQSFGAMRYAFYHAYLNQSDIVIGVHPRHAEFYVRMMSFEVIGQMSSHPKVSNRPVVPLLLDTTRIKLEPLPRMLRYFKANPIDAITYQDRYRFGKPSLAQSPIERFINYNVAAQKFKQFETSASDMPMQRVGNL